MGKKQFQTLSTAVGTSNFYGAPLTSSFHGGADLPLLPVGRHQCEKHSVGFAGKVAHLILAHFCDLMNG
jgi:hypothetical protein